MNPAEPDVGSPAAAPSVSSSLLAGLRDRRPDAWHRLVGLCHPTVARWCLRAGLQPADAEDVAQEVFRALTGNVGRFERGEQGRSFRGWLWGITRRQLFAHRRRRPVAAAGGTAAQQRLAELPEPPDDPSDVTTGPGELLRRAVTLLRAEVEERTWQAFWRAAVEGQAPADIAADLGLTVNAVYLAKARLLRRLREEFGALLT
jgi:RNA polymerase sigma-70 factor (ECF subfamily)